MEDDEEYEIVPLNPIRRMEKRVERLEKSGTTSETIRELIEIVKTHQRVIDDMVRINSELINKVSDLMMSVTSVTEKINDFMGRIDMSSEPEPAVSTDSGAYEDRLQKMEKRLNSLILSKMATKIRR